MCDHLHIELCEDGADTERLDQLTRLLRQEILNLDIEDVIALRAGEPPLTTRAFDITAIGGLAVSLGHSIDSLRTIVSTIQQWLARGGRAHRTVRLEIGGDVLALSNTTAAEQERLIELFVSQHARTRISSGQTTQSSDCR